MCIYCTPFSCLTLDANLSIDASTPLSTKNCLRVQFPHIRGIAPYIWIQRFSVYRCVYIIFIQLQKKSIYKPEHRYITNIFYKNVVFIFL